VEYLKFKKEWWAYRRMYHTHIRDELVAGVPALKDRSLSREAVIGDIEDL
jgi:hypothetical protein